MPKGFLSLFDDPVVGPQLALGLLNSGVGLLTSKPENLSSAIQPGLSLISQGLFYGGRQKAKKSEKEEKLAASKASAEEFTRRFLSGGPGGHMAPPSAPIGPSYTPGMGMPPFAPMQSQGPPAPMAAPSPPIGGSQMSSGDSLRDPGKVIQFALDNPQILKDPGMARVFGSVVTQSLQPKKLSKVEEYNQFADLAFASPEDRALGAKRQIGLVSTAAQQGTQDALARYREITEARLNRGQAMADADRNRGLDIQAAAQKATADNYANRLDLLKDGGGAKVSAFKQRMVDLGYEEGSPEYVKAGRIAAGLDPRAQGIGTPMYNEKGEVTGYLGGTGGKLTEEQGKATAFHMRGTEAMGQLDALEEIYTPTVGTQAAQKAGEMTGAVDRFLGEDGQKYEQSKRNFLTAVLRKESGATITPMETKEGNLQYFNVPGDSKSVVEQKKQNRATAMKAMAIMAGPGVAREPVKSPKEFDELPPPGQYASKRIKSPEGKVYRSNGTEWIPE